MISGRRKFHHISDVRDELGWLPVSQLHKQHCLTLLHQIISAGEPQALASLLQANSYLRSRQDADLALTSAREPRQVQNLVQHRPAL